MNAFTKRTVIFASLLSVGLSFSASVYRSASALPVGTPTETVLAQASPVNLSEESIEDTLQGTGELSREYRFTGTANEIVVVYWELDNGSYYYPEVELYDATGTAVDMDYNYPEEMFWEESDGRHVHFLLPTTGEYRLVFTSESVQAEGDFDYLLRARVASYYERLMIAADNLSYEESLPLLALAIEQEPDLPAPYLQRLLGQAEILFESEAFEARIAELAEINPAENPGVLYEAIYETFKTLDDESQAMAISDLRQVGRTFALAVRNGQTEAEGLPPEVFAGIADFLETGEPTDAITQLLFGEMSEPVEPVSPPPLPVEPMSPLPVEPIAPLPTEPITPD
ncbi:MAG: hypothetical protein AAFV85_10150 [Cyanobacteria bacterium J06634_6]